MFTVPITVLVLCANCAFGVMHQKSGKAKCCVPEDLPADTVAAATFMFPSHGSTYQSDPAYYTYEHSNEGPLMLDAHPPSYGGLGFHHYDTPSSFVQPSNENVQVITKYSKERKAGPVYTKSTVTRTNLDDPSRHTTIRKTDRFYPDPHISPYVIETNQPSKYLKQQFKSESANHPEKKKSIYKETTSEGKESSSFNRGVHFKKSYKEPQVPSITDPFNNRVVSTIQPLLVSTLEPASIEITPKSPLLKNGLFSTIGPSSIEVAPKFSDHSKLISTAGPSSVEIKSKFSDRISDSPLQEAGSKSFISSSLDSPSDDFFGGGFGYGYDAGKSYEKEKGEHYAEGHKKAEGHKSDKEYDVKEAFKKGEEEKHGSHHHKGSAHEQGGEKKGHIDEGKKYSEGHEVSKGEKSNDFLHKKGHRKGHKKSGFHTVHHKDEFKKDEHFFDEAHDTGEESEHGHKGHEHHKVHGGEKKEGHHDSAYHEEKHKKQGGKEEAHSHNEQAGHKAEEGHKSQHAEKAEHAKKEGHKEVEKHGHSVKEGHVE